MAIIDKSLPDISIHALAKRATFVRAFCIAVNSDFNPCPRKEGDAVKVGDTIKINDFNPRPRKEGDLKGKDNKSYFVGFQSTPSQRERRLTI